MCVNLAPAATGTSTLSSALKGFSNYSVHDHGMKISNIFKYRTVFRGDRAAAEAPLPRCFLVTLRQPADRMASGFRFDFLQSNVWKKSHKPSFTAKFGGVSGDAIVRAMRDPGHALHANASAFLRESPFGTKFPQYGYLQGYKCHKPHGRQELHILCNERLTEDIDGLFKNTFGVEKKPQQPPLHMAKHAADRTARLTKVGGDHALLDINDPENRAWLNEEVFATDTMIHRHFCGQH